MVFLLQVFGAIAALIWLPALTPLEIMEALLWGGGAVLIWLINYFFARRWVRQGIKLDPRGLEVHKMSWDLVAVEVPILEELVYRGLWLRGLGLFLPTTPALVITALVFMWDHKRPRAIGYDIALGLVFGLLTLQISLWASILAHGLWNANAQRLEKRRHAQHAAPPAPIMETPWEEILGRKAT